jgi:predicted DNA-binding transcriptional regulator AlpA
MISVPRSQAKRSPHDMLSHALALASAGMLVFPLHSPEAAGCSCRRPTCSQPGKHPRWMRGIMEHGSLSATTDPELIRRLWDRGPTSNIGIRTGEKSNLIMIGPDGTQGIADLAALVDQHGPLPETPVAVSGGGGRHYLFRHPGVVVKNKANHRGLKIDVRGEGGLFVAPPSLHRSGNRYAWERHPADVPIVSPPPWLVSWMSEPPRPPAPIRQYPRYPSGDREARGSIRLRDPKGLLLDCISRIVTGEQFTVATYTDDTEELRKRITSLVLEGDRLVLFDNLVGRFGNAVLDAALTATSWKDRLLGVIPDLAVLTKTSERHIHRLRDAGKIPGCVRLGRAVRFSKKIIDAWLAGEDS